MRTVAENLRSADDRLCAGIDELLGDDAHLRDLNTGDGFILLGPSHVFPALSLEKRRLQSQLADDLNHFMSMIHAVLRSRPRDAQRRVRESEKTLLAIVSQEHVSHRTTDGAKAAAKRAVDDLLEEVSCLHDTTEYSVVLVPDTNALIFNPSLRDWAFDGVQEFEIVLVPSVLAELDSLKSDHRNPDVRQKAQDFVRQIKEYRRRGSLGRGVPVVKNRITLRALAVEPDVDAALPWLDPSCADDRVLASCMEIVRERSRSAVALVTGDINLQNKAEFAWVPFLGPPERGA